MICKCCVSTTGLDSFRPPGVGWSDWLYPFTLGHQSLCLWGIYSRHSLCVVTLCVGVHSVKSHLEAKLGVNRF